MIRHWQVKVPLPHKIKKNTMTFFLFSGPAPQNKAMLSFNYVARRKDETAIPPEIRYFGAENLSWKIQERNYSRVFLWCKIFTNFESESWKPRIDHENAITARKSYLWYLREELRTEKQETEPLPQPPKSWLSTFDENSLLSLRMKIKVKMQPKFDRKSKYGRFTVENYLLQFRP